MSKGGRRWRSSSRRVNLPFPPLCSIWALSGWGEAPLPWQGPSLYSNANVFWKPPPRHTQKSPGPPSTSQADTENAPSQAPGGASPSLQTSELQSRKAIRPSCAEPRSVWSRVMAVTRHGGRDPAGHAPGPAVRVGAKVLPGVREREQPCSTTSDFRQFLPGTGPEHPDHDRPWYVRRDGLGLQRGLGPQPAPPNLRPRPGPLPCVALVGLR